MILLILLLFLIFGGGFGWWGNNRYGQTTPWAGPGIGLGTILVICLILYLFGGFSRF